MTESIPGPRPLPFFGNSFEISKEAGVAGSLERLADVHGDLFRFDMNGTKYVVCASASILRELMDETKFIKTAADFAPRPEDEPDGLFVAATADPDWGQSHRTLQSAFGPLSIESMFEGMRDIANQMCNKWARKAKSDSRTLLTDDFTRLTFDTIALCTMEHRFNSFYTDVMHPYVEALSKSLEYEATFTSRHWLANALLSGSGSQEADNEMDRICQGVIDRRRANPTDADDMLNRMLYGKDPKTGKTMRDSLIVAEMNTFLSAGHETTSALLSYAFTHMLKNPEIYLKARDEVDRVVGEGRITPKTIKKLPYVQAVLKEALRLNPPFPVLTKKINPDLAGEPMTLAGGKYLIPEGHMIKILLRKCHSDPSLFGDDASEFKPERMLEGNPEYEEFLRSWKPFGNGVRACIGQSFALIESALITALILRNFDMTLTDPAYQLRSREALTVKPLDLWVDVKLRTGVTPAIVDARLYGSQEGVDHKSVGNAQVENKPQCTAPDETTGKLTILYGTNAGTCQSLAQRLLASVSAVGISGSVRSMDSAVDDLPVDQLVIIITATYEGQPPDNAGRFVAWLEAMKASEAKGTHFAMFGCGDRNWKTSLFRIPQLVEKLLEERGGQRVCASGLSDVSKSNPLDDFEDWEDNILLPALRSRFNFKPSSLSEGDFDSLATQAEISTSERAQSLSPGMQIGEVRSVRSLTAKGQPEKRHMSIRLPDDAPTYEPGDYLSILPLNLTSVVQRIMAHFSLPWDSTIKFKSSAFAGLPANVPLAVTDVLSGYFELAQLPTRKALSTCARHSSNDATRRAMEKLAHDPEAFSAEISARKYSLFDVLSRYQGIEMPFAVFLSLLLPLKPRLYSISSSPLLDRQMCSISYSVVRGPSDADPEQEFEGVASTFLASLQTGDRLQCAFKQTATAHKACPFRLPVDKAKIPLIMFGAGTGIAPFRGFIQQRAIMLQNNPEQALAPAVLFIGCRDPELDRLYGDELDKWQEIGAVDVRYAFSRAPEKSEGCRYVGERLQQDWELVARLLAQDARVYTCGSAAFSQSMEVAADRTFELIAKKQGREFAEVKHEFEEALRDRAVDDIFD